MTSRRTFAALVAGTAIGILTPVARAQPKAGAARIGYLVSGERGAAFDAFRTALRELGYIEGRNIAIEFRASGGNYDALPALAAELVALKPDVIVTGGIPAALAAKHATTTIPIVAANVGDPIGAGLVTNLARPGGNVTGISHFASDLSGKQIDLFKEAVPGLARIGVLYNPTNPLHPEYLRETESVAQAKAVSLRRIDASDLDSLDRSVQTFAPVAGSGLLVLSDGFFNAHPRRIAELSTQAGLPMIAQYRQYTNAGGLLSYGPSLIDAAKRAAVYVDKILKGAEPSELPFEQPTLFELVVNLNTAKALGLSVPQSVLLRADQVIE